jgi:archaellum biogenesis protein FlaJ (TadC family)
VDQFRARALIVSFSVLQAMSLLFPILLGVNDWETSTAKSMLVQYFIVNPIFIVLYLYVYISQRKHLLFLKDILLKEEQSLLVQEQL